MRKTIYLPDELAGQVEEYLEEHQGLTLSSLVREMLEDRIASKRRGSILDLAGFVDVEPFESQEKARRFAGKPEDQFYDRV